MITREEHILMTSSAHIPLTHARRILCMAHKLADDIRKPVAICDDVLSLYVLPADDVGHDNAVLGVYPVGCGY